MMLKITLYLFFLLPLVALADRIHPESYYQEYSKEWLGGEKEVTMPDGTRCDLVNSSHAFEIDFANKWAQAIGQSLHYAAQTKKRAGVLLIMEHEGDGRFHKRIQSTIDHHKLPIDLIVIRQEQIN